MNLEQIQETFYALLKKANKQGAFELEESNAAIQALNGLGQLIQQRNQTITQATGTQTMDADNDLPKDPSKP